MDHRPIAAERHVGAGDEGDAHHLSRYDHMAAGVVRWHVAKKV